MSSTQHAKNPKYVTYFTDVAGNQEMKAAIDSFEEVIDQLHEKAENDGNEYTLDKETLESWIEEDKDSEKVEYSVRLLMTENFLHEKLHESLEGFTLKHLSDLFDLEDKEESREKQDAIISFVKQTGEENKQKEGMTNFGKSFYDLFIDASPSDDDERKAFLTAFGNNIHLFK